MWLIHLLLINRIHVSEIPSIQKPVWEFMHMFYFMLLILQNNEAGNDVKDLTGSSCVWTDCYL